MQYKKKVTVLTVITGVLVLVYGLTVFFDPERVNARNASFTWLPSGARDEADGIEITRQGAEPLVLVRKNDQWFSKI